MVLRMKSPEIVGEWKAREEESVGFERMLQSAPRCDAVTFDVTASYTRIVAIETTFDLPPTRRQTLDNYEDQQNHAGMTG